jgi:hypothetical protein
MRHAPQSGFGWLLAVAIFFAVAGVITFVVRRLRDDDHKSD